MFEKPQDDVDLPVPPVSEPNYDALERFAPLKTEDYESFKRDFLTWLATEGKRPFRGDGYADTTIHTTNYKVEMAYRRLWEQNGAYTTSFDPEEGEAFIDTLVTKSPKTDNEVKIFIKSLKRLCNGSTTRKGRTTTGRTPSRTNSEAKTTARASTTSDSGSSVNSTTSPSTSARSRVTETRACPTKSENGSKSTSRNASRSPRRRLAVGRAGDAEARRRRSRVTPPGIAGWTGLIVVLDLHPTELTAGLRQVGQIRLSDLSTHAITPC